jgi:hypothetical protein
MSTSYIGTKLDPGPEGLSLTGERPAGYPGSRTLERAFERWDSMLRAMDRQAPRPPVEHLWLTRAGPLTVTEAAFIQANAGPMFAGDKRAARLRYVALCAQLAYMYGHGLLTWSAPLRAVRVVTPSRPDFRPAPGSGSGAEPCQGWTSLPLSCTVPEWCALGLPVCRYDRQPYMPVFGLDDIPAAVWQASPGLAGDTQAAVQAMLLGVVAKLLPLFPADWIKPAYRDLPRLLKDTPHA